MSKSDPSRRLSSTLRTLVLCKSSAFGMLGKIVSDPSPLSLRLERTLAKYACLTKGETIRIFYNDRTYDIDVVEVCGMIEH